MDVVARYYIANRIPLAPRVDRPHLTGQSADVVDVIVGYRVFGTLENHRSMRAIPYSASRNAISASMQIHRRLVRHTERCKVVEHTSNYEVVAMLQFVGIATGERNAARTHFMHIAIRDFSPTDVFADNGTTTAGEGTVSKFNSVSRFERHGLIAPVAD